jgi:hypothetical protein
MVHGFSERRTFLENVSLVRSTTSVSSKKAEEKEKRKKKKVRGRVNLMSF